MRSVREEIEEVWKKYEEEKKRQQLMEEARAAALGFAKGAAGAVYDIANGATLGGAGKIDEKYFNSRMHDLDRKLKEDADQAGVSEIYDGIKGFNEGIGAGLGILGAKNLSSAGLNEAVKWNGRRELIGQLERGDHFKDIRFGKINKDTLSQINQIRKSNNTDLIYSPEVVIPADRVKHIYEQRVMENLWTPKETTQNLSNALFGKNSQVSKGDYDTLQGMINPSENNSSVGIIGKMRNKDNIFVKTTFKKDNKEIAKKFPNVKMPLDGRRTPSSDLAGSTPTFYSSEAKNNISPMESDVNMTIEELLKKWRRLLGL